MLNFQIEVKNMIQALNIHKKFDSLQVLKGVDLEINKGEIVAIVGASGAGKTTLLQILGTLDKPDNGQVIINNTDVSKLSDKEMSSFRNKNIGFIFQFHQLLPEFTALENVMMPALIAGTGSKKAKQAACHLLDELGLTERYEHKPAELSGGEKQRVAVARSLINNPLVILADEPSGSLDSHSKDELHRLLFSLRDKLGITIVIVTHDKELALLSDRVIEMKDGQIIPST